MARRPGARLGQGWGKAGARLGQRWGVGWGVSRLTSLEDYSDEHRGDHEDRPEYESKEEEDGEHAAR
jgi:hypothetical protein